MPIDPQFHDSALRLSGAETIRVEVGDAAFQHGGFEINRPVQPITARMSLRYSVAVALVDGGALVPQFSNERINQDDVWSLIDKVEVRHEASFDKPPHSTYTTRVTVMDRDGAEHEVMREAPHGGEGISLPMQRSLRSSRT